MVQIHYKGHSKGGLSKFRLFWAQMALTLTASIIRAQKNLDFQGPCLQMALVMDLQASELLPLAPYKQQAEE
jgi:hypothetical protein